MSRFSFLAALAIVGLIVVGCGKSDDASSSGGSSTTTTSTDTPKANEGNEGETKLADFAIVAPKDWVAIDLTQSDFETYLKGIIDKNAAVGNIKEMLVGYQKQGYIKLFAIDVAKASTGFADNMNVIVQELPAAVDFDTLVKENTSQLKQIQAPGTDSKTETVDLPAGKFAKIGYFMQQGAQKIAAWALIGMKDKKVVTITFSCGADRAADFPKVVDDAMKTFRWL